MWENSLFNKRQGNQRKTMNSDPLLTRSTKINPTWFTDPNIRVRTKKVLEENTGVNLHNLRLGKAFSGVT